MTPSTSSSQHAIERSTRIFEVIKDAATRGERCPSNAVLAERFSCGTTAIARSINFLETCGMLTVERSNSARVATIRATGQKTAGSIKDKHWTVRPDDHPWSDEDIDLLADMMAEGKGYGEIAAEFGRTKWSVRSRWTKLVRSMGWQAQ